ncbi:DUF1674 domain-containing protein [Mesorhizobium sp. CAU 1741]|uniref:DUF1674 domain-containing protein n=1 Tax=Mesorhizobium sp. CAU 1741 TaxID=3140366 RepID=UPI00325C31DD
MNESPDTEKSAAEPLPEPRTLSPAAQRALEEAEERRMSALKREAALPKEIGGRGGNDPARYGDWEVKGMASDF